jgi:hypothetical protein
MALEKDTTTGITGMISGRLEPILELARSRPGLSIAEFTTALGFVRGQRHRLGFMVDVPEDESGLAAAVKYGYVALSATGRIYLMKG